MQLSMLIENKALSGLRKEHGLSLLIEFKGRRLLFDTGASGAFVDNADKMGLDLGSVDSVILSHAHNDHTGGLPRFLGINKSTPVYISGQSTKEYFVKLLFVKENVSTPAAVFRDHKDRVRFVNDFTELGNDIFLVTKFERKFPLTKSNGDLLVKSDGVFRQDEFDHELALVMNNDGKLVIITGCSHSGAENMVESIIGLFPGIPIQTVIGGFHLIGFPFHKWMGESRENITALGKRLLGYGVGMTYTCHCSGDWGYSVLKETMGDKVAYFSTGMQIEL